MVKTTVQGVQVPTVGLGTWNLNGQQAHQAVLSALEIGYRHIDTAEMYRNEREIGQALKDSGIDRKDVFLVSKVWTNHLGEKEVVEACQASLNRLQTDYLDLYLVHWPSDSVPFEQTMAGMRRLMANGAARQVGVSNFSVEQMERARAALGTPLFCNQVKLHVDYRQDQVVEYCQQQDILIAAYTPLNKGRVGQRELLREIGGRHGKSGLQVALRWLVQQENMVAIPKSSNPKHQAINFDIFDFELTDEDMQRIDHLA